MYQESLYQFLSQKINERNIPFNEEESIAFLMRISSNFDVIHHLYLTIYQDHPKRSENFSLLTEILIDGFLKRPQQLRQLGCSPWRLVAGASGWHSSPVWPYLLRCSAHPWLLS